MPKKYLNKFNHLF